MKTYIGKTYITAKDNGWFGENAILKILDHRVRRTYCENFSHAERDPNIGTEYAPEHQETYEYEFAVKIYPLWPEGTPHHTTFNDMVLLDFISEYCEESVDYSSVEASPEPYISDYSDLEKMKTWRTKKDGGIAFAKMKTSHLINCFRMTCNQIDQGNEIRNREHYHLCKQLVLRKIIPKSWIKDFIKIGDKDD